ncbi:hypothetical protein JW979_14015 [bacterium]|nr:hypothetical protein [candidate division CSSED10-310 bacterium]
MAVENIGNVKMSNCDLVTFLEKNKNIDFLTFNLQDEKNIERLCIDESDEEVRKIVAHLKAFQRVLRIAPGGRKDLALTLIKAGIHSALQIAAMTRKDFMRRLSSIFHDDGRTSDEIYRNALQKKSVILIKYMNLLQNSEPHISSARFS